MKVVAIIQARSSSQRLPRKIHMDLAGKPVLQRVVERVVASHACDQVVIATSTSDDDREVLALCNTMKAPCFRGDLNDVLSRYQAAADAFSADVIVRITADCPLIDPEVICTIIDAFTNADVDYASNVIERSYPDGLDTEVLSRAALDRIALEATEQYDREHVTTYLLSHISTFRTLNVKQENDLSHFRWTLDTADDLAFMRAVYTHFGDRIFSMNELAAYLKDHPEIAALNARGKETLV